MFVYWVMIQNVFIMVILKESVKNTALQVCTYPGLSFLEANEMRENISYTVFAAHLLQEQFPYSSLREKVNNILYNSSTQNPGNLKLFLSASSLPSPHIGDNIGLHSARCLKFPMMYALGPIIVPYHVYLCSY